MPDIALLEHLAEVVRQRIDADSALDMSVFWHPCGTFGCVAGWAAHDPHFQALGLVVQSGTYAGNRQGAIMLQRYRAGVPYTIAGFDALTELFALDEVQVAYLFGDAPLFTGFERIIDWHDALSRIYEVLRGEV